MCTPTRVGFITERYQQRVAPVLEAAIGNASSAHAEVGLPATGRSLPQLLKNNGYATALIGEWHLGYRANFTPNAHGFDHFLGFLSGYIDFCQHTDGAGAPTSSRTAPPSRERAI